MCPKCMIWALLVGSGVIWGRSGVIRECSNVQFLGFWRDLGIQNHNVWMLGWTEYPKSHQSTQFVCVFSDGTQLEHNLYFLHIITSMIWLRHDSRRETVACSKWSASHWNVLKVNAFALSSWFLLMPAVLWESTGTRVKHLQRPWCTFQQSSREIIPYSTSSWFLQLSSLNLRASSCVWKVSEKYSNVVELFFRTKKANLKKCKMHQGNSWRIHIRS